MAALSPEPESDIRSYRSRNEANFHGIFSFVFLAGNMHFIRRLLTAQQYTRLQFSSHTAASRTNQGIQNRPIHFIRGRAEICLRGYSTGMWIRNKETWDFGYVTAFNKFANEFGLYFLFSKSNFGWFNSNWSIKFFAKNTFFTQTTWFIHIQK